MGIVINRRRLLGGLGALVSARAAIAEPLHVLRMGVESDSRDDQTSALQKAIDAAATWADKRGLLAVLGCDGGAYHVSSLEFRSNVQLIGQVGNRYQQGAAKFYSTFTQDHRSLFEAPQRLVNWGLIGISLDGSGRNSRSGGIDLPNAEGGTLAWVSIDNFGGLAALVGGGNNRVIECEFQGLYDSAAVDQTYGAFTLRGADHQVLNCEFAGPSQYRISSSNLNCAAAVIDMADGLVEGCVFEAGDVGLVSRGLRVRYVACRFDTNAGHGLLLDGGYDNTFDACHWGRNSFAASGVYDDIRAPAGGGGRNAFLSPLFSKYGDGDTRYRINDEKQGRGWGNAYTDPRGTPAIEGFARITGSSAVYPRS